MHDPLDVTKKAHNGHGDAGQMKPRQDQAASWPANPPPTWPATHAAGKPTRRPATEPATRADGQPGSQPRSKRASREGKGLTHNFTTILLQSFIHL